MDIKEKFKALTPESRKNIIGMLILGVLFIIGIITRWEYTKTEIGDSVNRYVEVFDTEKTDTVTVQNKK